MLQHTLQFRFDERNKFQLRKDILISASKTAGGHMTRIGGGANSKCIRLTLPAIRKTFKFFVKDDNDIITQNQVIFNLACSLQAYQLKICQLDDVALSICFSGEDDEFFKLLKEVSQRRWSKAIAI